MKMYENNNKKIINEIAKEQYKNHKLRNYISILAISLTAILITAMLTAGFSLLSTADNAMEQAPGPEAHGSIEGGKEHFEKILKEKEIEWADFVEKCSKTPLHNNEFGGIETRLFAPDMNFYNDNHINMLEGSYPKTTSEIIISDTMVKNLGIESPVGKDYPLDVVILKDETEVEQKIPMKISGVYKNPLYQISSIYEEIYTAPGFAKEFNPKIGEENHIIYVKFNNLNPILLKRDIEVKLYALCDKVGGMHASAGKNSQIGFNSALVMVLPILFLVLLLMSSGYFLIYNIFHISISSDIRWFGMMKTIGTTKKQLKSILNIQINRMSVIGIGIGVIVGYAIGCLIAPQVIKTLTDWGVYYKAPPFIQIGLLAIIFAWTTVRVSARKPLQTASAISSVEAAKYVPPKKKNIFTIVSLALSCSILLIVVNVVLGFQTNIYIDRYNQNDFQVRHKSSMWASDERYQPISQSLVERIGKLPFIKQEDIIYMARTNDEEDMSNFYFESTGEIKPEGKLYNYYQKLLGEHISMNTSSRENFSLNIFGMPAHRWKTEMTNYNILSGEIDEEKFASGDYIVYQEQDLDYLRSVYGITSKATKEDRIQAGDILDLSFYDKERDCYIEKELTVMAVIERANEYSSSDIGSAVIVMPDRLFKEIYSQYDNMIASIQLTAKEDLSKDQIAQIMNFVKEEHSTQLMTSSRYQQGLDAENVKTTYAVIGFLLVAILGIIGISNVSNTVAADIFAHRIEYASMQSIGMTKKQLFLNLLRQSGRFSILAVIFTIPLGGIGAYMLGDSAFFTGFNAILYIETIFVIVIIMFAICAAMAKILTNVLNQKSIVERLREIE